MSALLTGLGVETRAHRLTRRGTCRQAAATAFSCSLPRVMPCALRSHYCATPPGGLQALATDADSPDGTAPWVYEWTGLGPAGQALPSSLLAALYTPAARQDGQLTFPAGSLAVRLVAIQAVFLYSAPQLHDVLSFPASQVVPACGA